MMKPVKEHVLFVLIPPLVAVIVTLTVNVPGAVAFTVTFEEAVLEPRMTQLLLVVQLKVRLGPSEIA